MGGLRWGGITKYLVRAGWSVDVLASADVERPDEADGVRIHTAARARTLNDLYRALRSGGASGDGSDGDIANPGRPSAPARPRLLGRLRRGLAAFMAYPGFSRGWFLRAAFRARRIIRQRRIDMVVTSGPPHIAHSAGIVATAGTGVRWVADLRDPWSSRFGPETPAALIRFTRWLEAVTMRRADAVVANTREFAGLLSREYPEQNVHWVPNGIDLETLPPRLDPPVEPVTIAYAGTLYLNRDLGPILEAMHRYGAEGGDRRVKLSFAGYTDAPHLARLKRQRRELEIPEDRLEILGPIPRSEARDMLRRAHLALVLAQGQPLQVPAKLYELVGIGVPTLVLTDADSATAREAERIGAAWCEAGDTEGIVDVIRRVADGSYEQTVPEEGLLGYEAIARAVAPILRGPEGADS